jgi:hypothetical protein
MSNDGMRMRRAVLGVVFVLLLSGSPASGLIEGSFPRVRMGSGSSFNSGSGVVAGDSFAARSSVVAWNRRFNSLTLYLFPSTGATCGTLRRTTARPGHLIQVYVTGRPRVYVQRPMADPQVAFVTVFANKPEQISGLKHGGQLTFTRVDSYPGGTWYGAFKVPTRTYGDGKVYGYKGTFAAAWCELRQ